VASFVTLGPWPNERLKNETVNSAGLLGESDSWVAVAGNTGAKNVAFLFVDKGLHTPKIRDSVLTLVTNNWQPHLTNEIS
jgi:hypothetical protein